jgi:hypothetical protein
MDPERVGQLMTIGEELLRHPNVAAAVASATPGQATKAVVSRGGIDYEVLVTLQGGINGLVSFYPLAGAGVEHLSKDAMRTAISLFKSR